MQLQRLVNEQMKKSKKLQELAFVTGIPYKKSKEIRDLQEKTYNKFLFLKNLNNVWSK